MVPIDMKPPTAIVYPWVADQSNGTYRNPILCADYSDPDVIRDGDDFYMTASSFNCTPGLPVLHSRDLVNWTIINHAVENLPDPRGVYDTVQPGCGVWAPAIRKHDGKFWIFFPMPDEGIYFTTANDPAGQWSTPHLVQAGKGLIDPCPLWDDDGKAYLVFAYANSRSGIKHKLRISPMAPDGSALLGDGQIVYDDPKTQPTLEGPKLHKRNGYYFISAPAGGVATGWQLILRSKNIYGPYEPKIVLAQRDTPINGPHQGAIIDTPNGQGWFIHFQERLPVGRIVHLQPLKWVDDWPVIGINQDENGVGQPVLTYAMPSVEKRSDVATPQTGDEFDSAKLGLQWQWQANHHDDWFSLTQRTGFLRLIAQPTTEDFHLTPNLLLQKFPASTFTAETKVDIDAGADIEAGLVIAGKTNAAVCIKQSANNEAQIIYLEGNSIRESHPLDGRAVVLRVNVQDDGRCVFSFKEANGAWQKIGGEFQAQLGVWIGAKVGVFARTSGTNVPHADFDYFRFLPPE